jgi:endoglucanase
VVTTTTSVTGTSTKIEAENYVNMSGVQNENTSDAGGGLNVGYIDPNDWMDYSVNIPSSGSYTVNFRVATQNSNAQLQLRKTDGTVLATVKVPSTGGYQTWQTISATVSLPAGTQTLKVFSTSSQWNSFNMNWLEITGGSSSIPTPTPTPGTGTTAKIEAENYTSMSGVQKENTQDAGGGQNVGYIDPNDWMDYNVNVSSAGTYAVNFRIASQSNSAKLELRKADGSVLATVSVPNTGGYQTWQTVSANVNLSAGQQTLRIVSTSAQWNSYNINWFELVGGSLTTTMQNSNVTLSEATSTTTSLEIFPETITDRFALQVNNNLTGSVKVDMLNLSGASQKQFWLTKAAEGSSQFYLSIGDLAAGNYIIKVTMDGWSESKQITKQ